MSNLVQYIIVNAQLKKCLYWSSEKIIIHCCDATSAVNRSFLHVDDDTRKYVTENDNKQMRKIVLQVTFDWNSLKIFSTTFLIIIITQYSG